MLETLFKLPLVFQIPEPLFLFKKILMLWKIEREKIKVRI